MTRLTLPASYFGIVLGLSGLGQAWRLAHTLWGYPSIMGEVLLALATVVWSVLLVLYTLQAIRHWPAVADEFRHPVQGCTPALLGVSTLLIVLAVIPYSRSLAWALSMGGITWHVVFSLWHNGGLWKGGRNKMDSVPALYLPTVAGNFTSAAALGALGFPDWGWLFLGAGIFSWLALESVIIQRLWQDQELPLPQRPLIGIQFAPPVVCAMALLSIKPDVSEHWVLMLLGYGLYQLLLGIRLGKWLAAEPFAPSYWAYTFGIGATTVSGLKLALSGVPAAQIIAIPVFIGANLFIAYLSWCTLKVLFLQRGK
jgi:tellurite resistance protein